MSATRGPMCGEDAGPAWLDAGTLVRTRTPTRAPTGAGGLSDEEQALLLDLAQMALDLAGVLDPTPLADGTSALISAGRGDWLGFGLSGLSAIPYIGDLAKAGKLGRWAETVHKAVSLAARNPVFEARARPLLQRLAVLSLRVPDRMLPAFTRARFAALKKSLSRYAPATWHARRSQAIDALLDVWYRDVDKVPLPAPGRDRGALWSKLDAKTAGQPGYAPKGDDDTVKGMDLAIRLARQDGRKTLESVVDTKAFKDKLDFDQAALAERFGVVVEWGEFQAKVWERLSLRYAKSLQGRVVVYVDDEVLKQALRHNRLPVLSAELQELLRRRRAGDGVTDIVVKDIFDGTTFEL